MGQDTKDFFHLSLSVQDLPRSVEFYGRLLGIAPTKYYADYAKFELADPPLVLSLDPVKDGGAPGLNHLGIRLPTVNALVDQSAKIAERGLTYEHLQGVNCCYARQSKIFLNDPDGHLFEVYTVEADLEPEAMPAPSAEASVCDLAEGVYEHMIPTSFPARLPAADGTLKEINLRGTFNATSDAAEDLRVLKECHRALAPGGKITAHILAADKPVKGEVPKLPEPAAHVRRVPVDAELLGVFAELGFIGLTLRRFSHAGVFSFGGSEFREFLAVAHKRPEASDRPQDVVYKGPFPSVSDEYGNTFARGQRVRLDGQALASLRVTPAAESFVFLSESMTNCSK